MISIRHGLTPISRARLHVDAARAEGSALAFESLRSPARFTDSVWAHRASHSSIAALVSRAARIKEQQQW